METWKLFCIIIIIGIITFFYVNPDSIKLDPMEYNQDLDKQEIKNIDNFKKAEFIYHYGKMPITYKFKSECVGPIVSRLKLAFNIISNNTDNIVTFLEVNKSEDANIVVNCFAHKIVGDGEITLGEGRPTYVDSLNDYLIINSELNFYSITNTTSTQSCFDIPSVEIHEIFHAIGIDHHEGSADIMSKQFDYFTCRSVKKINDKYITCLKSIYSDNLPDCEGVNFL